MTRGGKKRRRDDSDDAAIHRTTPALISHEKNTADHHNHGSRHQTPSAAMVNTPMQPTFNANVQIPECIASNIRSQHNPSGLAITSKEAEGDRQLDRSTFAIGERSLSPPADLAYPEAFPAGGLPAQTDTHSAAALSLETNFNRNSTPICQRPYGAPLFVCVLEGNIRGVYDILICCEGSLWDHDPYGLGLLYGS